MLIALLTLLFLGGGGSSAVLAEIAESRSEIKEVVVDDERRDAALDTLKDMKARQKAHSKDVRSTIKALKKELKGASDSEVVDATWDAYFTAMQATNADMIELRFELRDQLTENTAYFRDGLERLGFELLPGQHPIVPVMLHDAALAARFADAMLKRGVYVVAFSFPVVPRGKARIRTQMSAALTRDDLDMAINAFGEVKTELGL